METLRPADARRTADDEPPDGQSHPRRLTERRTIRGFAATNDANFPPGSTQAEVKVWADGFEPTPKDPKADPKAEPKPRDKAGPITLLVGRAREIRSYVRRVMPDGTKADFILPDKIKVGLTDEPVDLLVTLKKSRLDLLDPNLKRFSPEVANKVMVTGTANYELDKDDKKDLSTAGRPVDVRGAGRQEGEGCRHPARSPRCSAFSGRRNR